MKGWGEGSYPWIPHNRLSNAIPYPFAARQCEQLSPTHPSAGPCVFLIHYLKERNAAHTKINIAHLDQTMCHSDSSSERKKKKKAVVLTVGGWNSLALQSVCHSALCLRHTAVCALITWFRAKRHYFKADRLQPQHSGVKQDSLDATGELTGWTWACGFLFFF